MFARFPDGHVGNSFDNPFKIGLTHRGRFGVGRGIAKINCEWDSVPDGKLYCV